MKQIDNFGGTYQTVLQMSVSTDSSLSMCVCECFYNFGHAGFYQSFSSLPVQQAGK